ncbi:MAG: pilin [Candidatus Kaiserbacteria bacterium]|nr:pilin [Candidatus Kaiserbacteria bacterium]
MNIAKKIGLWFSCASAGFFASVAIAYSATNDARLENPLNSAFSTVPDFISGVLRVVVMIALPIITIFIVFAGFKFLAARGNSSKLDEAKKNFMWVIVGALLIMGAWVLATLIAGTVTQLVGKV